MHLAPREIEKLMLHNAGSLAQKRYARGLKLNYVESVALIAAQLLEFIRDGESVADLMNTGKGILGLADVMPGVADMVHEVQVEGTFPDGSKLVTVHNPICREAGDPALALYGSGLTRATTTIDVDNSVNSEIAETQLAPGDILLNADRDSIEIEVMNTGDRPVQVGSHYPFFETNAALRFDRELAFGKRLDIPSGTAVRFEPGERKTVALIDVGGLRIVRGGNNLTDGPADEKTKAAAMAAVATNGFEHKSAGGAK